MIYQDTTAIDAVNEGRDTPDAFYHKSTLIAVSNYVHTDGWRGYTEIKPVQGFKELEADWVTGDYSDAPAGNSSSEVEAKIKALEAKHGDVHVIYAPTSNVFSTSYAVIVRDTEAKPLKGKTIALKTKRYELDGGGWRVQYYATDVVIYDGLKNSYTLNTGGWNTLTTSKRMTDALPAGWYVYRKNWVMYIHIPGIDDQEIKDGMEI